MDGLDIDCLSCAYPIKDFTSVVSVECGHGVIHRNCLYFNNGCPECQGKLVAAHGDQKIIQFRPGNEYDEENLKIHLSAINESLVELKDIMKSQRNDNNKMAEIIKELRNEVKSKDMKILDLQKEIYTLKLEKVESIKKDLEEKLNNLS